MKFKKHLRLLLYVTLIWFLFWVAGLPGYYRQYSTQAMILFDIIIFFPIYGVGYYLINRKKYGSKVAHAIRLSFYFTVPFFFYDYFYCAMYLQQGWSFLTDYWYLSVYYLIPWIVLPPTGVWLARKARLLNGT
jgi:surface polysaccharide O-acyltransferase-like enzyme